MLSRAPSPPARARTVLELAVRDTGIGIPQDRMDRLFAVLQPGRRVDDAPLRRHRARARDLAAPRRADGRDDVGGERGGRGLDVPHRARRSRRPRCRPASRPATGCPQLAGKRILVVDDNATNREIVIRHARSWGMEPRGRRAPLEALALIERRRAVRRRRARHADAGDGRARAGARDPQHRDGRELPLRAPHVARPAAAGAQRRRSSARSSRSRSRPRSSTTRCVAAARRAASRSREVAEPAPDGDRPAASSLRILLAEDNAVNQKVALRAARAARLPRRRGLERARGARGARAAAVRRRADGRADAGAGRPRRHRAGSASAGRPETRPRIIAMTANAHARGSRGVLRRRDGRLRREADPARRSWPRRWSARRRSGTATSGRTRRPQPRRARARRACEELGGDDVPRRR